MATPPLDAATVSADDDPPDDPGAPLDQPRRYTAAYLASQQWTADRVREELIDERFAAPRYEFIDGELLVSPSPEYLHQVALRELFRLLDPYVAAHGLGEVAWSPSDVEIEGNTTAQPDLFVLPPDQVRHVRRRGYHRIQALTLAVEILSPSTRRADRGRKREFYTRTRVPEYWVVDLDGRAFEVSGPDDPVGVTVCDHTLSWHPDAAPEPLVLDVRAYFNGVLGPA